jgi:NADH-quinone oxidoreductase subunit E
MGSYIKVEQIISNYPRGDPSNLISILQDIQEVYGWISEKNILTVSEYLGVAPAKIYGVATFYAQFRLKPLGRHIINVCRGTACHVKGSERLLPILEQELGCKVGETTKDGKFTLGIVACLGACSIAPVINVDGEFYGNVKSSDIKKILRKYD